MKRRAQHSLGGGQKFRFWEDPWTADEVPLMVKFPRLYQISRQQNQLINQVGSVTNQGWEWKFNWRRSLFDSEVEMADTFMGEIPQQLLEFHKEDTWIWKFDSSGYYSTSSGYKLIWGEIMGAHQNSEFSELWKLKIPAKAAVFAWRLIRNRLPTKKNLSRRQVQVNDILCPFCRNKEEDAAHLFFTCNSILPLWWESMSWVNLSSAMPQHPRDHYLQHGHNAAEGKKSTRWKCWWIALTFTIWKHRNKIVFQSAIFDGSKLLDDAVLLIWSWIKTMEKDFVMHFNHWSSNLKEGFSS
ncbi:putative ribonuclease H protein [Glycine soja]